MEIKKVSLNDINLTEINKLKQDLAAARSLIRELEVESDKIADQILKLTLSNTQILNEHPWRLDNCCFCLISDASKHKVLTELLQTDYHQKYSTTISNIPIDLHFDDNDIAIYFRSNSHFIDFIKLTQLNVDLKPIKDSIESLETSIEQNKLKLEKLKNEFEKQSKLCQEAI